MPPPSSAPIEPFLSNTQREKIQSQLVFHRQLHWFRFQSGTKISRCTKTCLCLRGSCEIFNLWQICLPLGGMSSQKMLSDHRLKAIYGCFLWGHPGLYLHMLLFVFDLIEIVLETSRWVERRCFDWFSDRVSSHSGVVWLTPGSHQTWICSLSGSTHPSEPLSGCHRTDRLLVSSRAGVSLPSAGGIKSLADSRSILSIFSRRLRCFSLCSDFAVGLLHLSSFHILAVRALPKHPPQHSCFWDQRLFKDSQAEPIKFYHNLRSICIEKKSLSLAVDIRAGLPS